MTAQISPLMPDGVRLIACDKVGSTNAEGLRRYRDGEGGPAWIWALDQVAGRGRMGRRWVSGPGNLHATMLLEATGDRHNLTELSFIAGLAVFDTAADLLGSDAQSELALKWPNDMLIDGAKVAGILLESEVGNSGNDRVVVIGIGLNITNCPEDGLYRSTCLARHGVTATPGEAMERLAACFAKWLDRWDDGRNFSEILRVWTARAAGIGKSVIVQGATGDLSGTFTGLAANGALILRDDNGAEHKVLSGDLFLDPVGDGQ